MSAADEVLKLREEVIHLRISRSAARAAQSRAEFELSRARAEVEKLKQATLMLAEQGKLKEVANDQLHVKATTWRIVALVMAAGYAVIWANTYLFGGAL